MGKKRVIERQGNRGSFQGGSGHSKQSQGEKNKGRKPRKETKEKIKLVFSFVLLYLSPFPIKPIGFRKKTIKKNPGLRPGLNWWGAVLFHRLPFYSIRGRIARHSFSAAFPTSFAAFFACSIASFIWIAAAALSSSVRADFHVSTTFPTFW